jgi:hypothetical protein
MVIASATVQRLLSFPAILRLARQLLQMFIVEAIGTGYLALIPAIVARLVTTQPRDASCARDRLARTMCLRSWVSADDLN